MDTLPTTDIPGFPAGSIRFDGDGRASLTDMHRIAGGSARARPHDWLRRLGVRDLVARENGKREMRFGAAPGLEVVRTVRGGNYAGTWAAPAIAREYALFLAPRFHPWREWRGRPDLLARVMDGKFWPEWPAGEASKKS